MDILTVIVIGFVALALIGLVASVLLAIVANTWSPDDDRFDV